MKKIFNIVMLTILLGSYSQPYINAAELVKEQDNIDLLQEQESILYENDTYLGEDTQVEVEANTSYMISSTDATQITVDDQQFEGDDFVYSSGDQSAIIISSDSTTDLVVTELASEAKTYQFDVSANEVVNFTYEAIDNVTAGVALDGEYNQIENGDNSIDVEGIDTIELRVYDPLDETEDYTDIIDNVLVDEDYYQVTEQLIIPTYTINENVTAKQLVKDSGVEVDAKVDFDGDVMTEEEGTFDSTITVTDGSHEQTVTIQYDVKSDQANPEEVTSESDESRTYGHGSSKLYDEGDAPLSYGRGKIEVGDYKSSNTSGFYLGFDTAAYDQLKGDASYSRDGLGDDKSPTMSLKAGSFGSGLSPDDETGFLYHVQDENGIMQINANLDTVDYTIPYENTSGKSGQVAVWIDFDGNGKFDSDEYSAVPIKKSSGGKYGSYDGGPDNYYRNAAEFSINIPDDITTSKTYMRVLLTTQTGDISDQGNNDVYSGVGEVEDYPVNFIKSDIDDCDTAGFINQPSMEYDRYVTETAGYGKIKAITFKNIKNPAGPNFDLKVSTSNPSRYPLVEPESYPINPDGIFTGFNEYGTVGNATITIETFLASDGRTPYPLPLQITTHDLDHEIFNGRKIGEWITNISDAQRIWGEEDNIYTFTGTSIMPNTSATQPHPYINVGSRQRATWITSQSARHSFKYTSENFGALSIVISFPGVYTELPECPEPEIPNTTIKKTLTDASGDGVAQVGETLHYQIDVTSTATTEDSTNVSVRDSLLENLPSYLTWDGKLTVTGNDSTYKGDFKDGSFTLDRVAAGETVTIKYDLVVTSTAGITSIDNIVRDDGKEPTVCDEADKLVDCDEATIDVEEEIADTEIIKSIIGESIAVDGIVSDDEAITYELAVTNTSSTASAKNVQVRDSLLENLPAYASYDGKVVVTPADTTYSGSLTEGTFVINEIKPSQTVKISYTIKFGTLPNDITEIANIATDNGDLVEICPPASKDCSEVVLPLAPDTVIEKTVSDEDKNGIAQAGEVLTYTLKVTNPTSIDAHDVAIRDSLLEDLPAYLTYNNDLSVSGSEYTGDITEGTLVLATVAGGSTVTITYSVTVGEIPDDVTEIENIATDNGDLVEICPPKDPDCAITVTPTAPNTIIEKSIASETGDIDGVVEDNELVTYQLDITNPSKTAIAYDVIVRDSMLENLPSFATWDGKYTINPNDTAVSGDLGAGTFVISQIAANSTVTITYNIQYGEIPNDLAKIGNMATDNGDDPKIPIDPEKPQEICPPGDEDCSIVVIPTEPETVIEKAVEDGNGNGIAEDGEVLTYTISVNNNTSVDAVNVAVRDSLLENLPGYLTYNNDQKVVGSESTGSLSEGNLVLAKVAANSKVTITYSVTVGEIPDGVESVVNIATDNGDLVEICPPSDPDCAITVTPTNPDTIIEKSIIDETGQIDGVVEDGESITYSVAVTNTSATQSAIGVPVRDSILENLPDFVVWDGKVSVKPAGTKTSGDLAAGTFEIAEIKPSATVTLEYTLKYGEIPSELATIANLVTDNGDDPEIEIDPGKPEEICPPKDPDCSIVVEPTNPETIIAKSVVDSDEDGIAEEGETLTYTIEVRNLDANDAANVAVRDSLLENLPSYLTYNKDMNVVGSTYTGDLTAGTLVLDTVPANSTVTITYSVTVGIIPDDVTEVENIVTDNGKDPEGICIPSDPDCAITVTPTPVDTVIEKAVSDSDGDGLAEVGEDLTYTITVKNPHAKDALDVPVRDSLVENTPSYLTYNEDMKVEGSDYTGDLQTSDLVLANVPAKNAVVITYSVTVNTIPNDVADVINIATDNGGDPSKPVDPSKPEEICPEGNEDCDETITPVNPETLIDKAISSETGKVEGVVEDYETVTYKVTVTNPNKKLPAQNVAVRDSFLEDLPAYASFDGIVKVTPSDVETSGSLTDGNFVISQIAANSSVSLEYSIEFGDIPNSVEQVRNLVTDNGDDPQGICPPKDPDCSEVIVPTNPDTVIEKAVEDASGNGIAEVGEVLNYTITVSNPTKNDSYNVAVRDSLLENLPNYLTYNDDLKVNGSKYTGSLVDGDLVLDKVAAKSSVTLTYSVTVDSIPNNVGNVLNIVTDNGQDPSKPIDPSKPEEICPPGNDDCDETITPVDPNTVIEKAIIEEDGKLDDVIEDNETVTYQLSVTNPNTMAAAHDVIVRDSMLENMPEYAKWDGNFTVNPESITYTGELADGTFTIDQILPGQTVTITYTIEFGDIPEEVESIGNMATDNGGDPSKPIDPDKPEVICPEGNEDCDFVVNPTAPETLIDKQVEDASGNGIAEAGEILTYTITITNTDTIDAVDVAVRDSMLESLPSYLSYNNDLEVFGSKYTGDLTEGTLVLDKVAAKSDVELVYSITVNEIPNDVQFIENMATDNGQDPDTIDVCDPATFDCDETITPVAPNTVIEKTVEDASGNGLAEVGEVLTYQLTVTNTSEVQSAFDVIVRDSLLENLPEYLTYNEDMKVVGSTYKGDLEAGTLTLDEIKASSSVVITYSITVDEIPSNVSQVANVATDNGSDPSKPIDPDKPEVICPEGNEDCDETITPVNPETVITKEVAEETGSVVGVVEDNEEITYAVNVTNTNNEVAAQQVAVRDSMIENLPTYASYDGNFTVSPKDVTYSGELADGSLVIDEIAAGATVTITYTIAFGVIPNDVESVLNVVTDNGQDPNKPVDPNKPEVICPEGNEDCDQVIIPTNPDTVIEKSVEDENGNGYAQAGEVLNYTVVVSNNTNIDSYNVAVRDSLLENLPSYATYNEDIKIEGSEYSGDITNGSLILDKVEANSDVTITYSLTLAEQLPSELAEVLNVVTDNGMDPNKPVDPSKPEEICPEGNEDCDEALIPTPTDTIIDKESAIDGNGDGIAQIDETIEYSVAITNRSETVSALNVPVRDSLLENIEVYSWLEFNSDVEVEGSKYSGDLTDSSFVLEEVKPGQTVLITYSVTLTGEPTQKIVNIVTDNGDEPTNDKTKTDDSDFEIVEIGDELLETGLGSNIIITTTLVLIVLVATTLKKRINI